MGDIRKLHIYIIQILLVGSITFGSQGIHFDNKHNLLANVACYVLYILMIRASQEVYILLYNLFHKNYSHLTKTTEQFKSYFALFASSATLVYSKQEVFGASFLFFFIAYLVVKFPKKGKRLHSIFQETRSQILSYGSGMACSFFEGYLAHVIPPDGHKYVGFKENVTKYESKHGVAFPVQRLFIIITESMYCPPDLKEFNKENRHDIPYLEACQPLDEFKKDVAGVKDRKYHNTVYKIIRPDGKMPVFLAVASALNTFYRVLRNKSLCEVLININVDEVVKDFCATLSFIIAKSPEYKGKCELVYYNSQLFIKNHLSIVVYVMTSVFISNRMGDIRKLHIYIIQILLVGSITFACYVLYILMIRASQEVYILLYNLFHKNYSHLTKTTEQFKSYFALFASSATLVYSKQEVFGASFLFFFIAYLVVKFPKKGKRLHSIFQETRSQILSYGSGMACSFFEGYLAHVIPPDGHKYVGFKENVTKYESKHGVAFPVQRLFIIITESMYCPPDLKEFNKENRHDIPYLEACQPLDEFKKDVAGVKDRKYHNTVYKIIRPDGKMPVFLAVASALNTFYRVLRNKSLCEVLININVDEVVKDFCATLSFIIAKSPEYKDKCELVYYNNKDPKQNLADILLERIRYLECDFEHIIIERTKRLNSHYL